MEKEGQMPRAQYQTDAGGRKWAERRNLWNLWKEEICEEQEFPRVIIPLEKPQSTRVEEIMERDAHNETTYPGNSLGKTPWYLKGLSTSKNPRISTSWCSLSHKKLYPRLS